MKRIGLIALRVCLGALFVYAGAMKLRDVSGFVEEIGNYRLLSQLAPLLGNTLPAIEIVSGIALIVAPRSWRSAAALLTTALLLVFTVAVASAWLRGIDVRCGCFGTGGGPVGPLTVARDVALVLVAAIVTAASRRVTER